MDVKERLKLITWGEPEDFTKKKISFRVFYSGVRDFLMENFRGAVNLEENITSSEYLLISPDGVAFLFKCILNAVYGDTVVNINIASAGKTFTITFDWKKLRPLTESEIITLTRISKLSGFSVEIKDSDEKIEVLLSTEAKIYDYLSIYAPTLVNEVEKAFHRIFYLT